MATVRWRLKEFLEESGISVYRLHKELEGHVSKTALYNINGGRTSSVDFALLAHVIRGLEILSGVPVEVGDLLVYRRDST